ncbi:MAG: hypothetical protein EBQ89_02910, partial [Alphaproteobacteria bacterium]|nr:hypothetical protein [Alphaproteobacteria bacterium]
EPLLPLCAAAVLHTQPLPHAILTDADAGEHGFDEVANGDARKVDYRSRLVAAFDTETAHSVSHLASVESGATDVQLSRWRDHAELARW